MAALLAATSTADWLATELVHMQERIGHSSRNSSKTAVSSESPGHRLAQALCASPGGSYRQHAVPVSQTHTSTSLYTGSSRRLAHPPWVGLAWIWQSPLRDGSS